MLFLAADIRLRRTTTERQGMGAESGSNGVMEWWGSGSNELRLSSDLKTAATSLAISPAKAEHIQSAVRICIVLWVFSGLNLLLVWIVGL
jgi:hypothetical protein